MSTATVIEQLQNKIHIDYDLAKIFLRGNRFIQGTFENNTGAGPVDFPIGTVVGREATSGNIVPYDSAVTADGESIVLGVLAEPVDQLADAGTKANVSVCVAGDVAEELVSFDSADTLDTVVSLRRIRDKMLAETLGIMLVTADELSGVDNS